MSVVWIGNGFSNENMKEQETKMKQIKKCKKMKHKWKIWSWKHFGQENTKTNTNKRGGREHAEKNAKKDSKTHCFSGYLLGFGSGITCIWLLVEKISLTIKKNKKTGFLCSYFVFPPRKLGENGEKKSGKMKIKRKQMKNEEKNVKLSLCLKPITCKCTSSILCFGSILDLRVRCCHMNHSLNRLN